MYTTLQHQYKGGKHQQTRGNPRFFPRGIPILGGTPIYLGVCVPSPQKSKSFHYWGRGCLPVPPNILLGGIPGSSPGGSPFWGVPLYIGGCVSPPPRNQPDFTIGGGDDFPYPQIAISGKSPVLPKGGPLFAGDHYILGGMCPLHHRTPIYNINIRAITRI